MLTAYSDKSSVIKCAQIGIAGFLAKPFDIKRVRAKIYEILQISPQAAPAPPVEEEVSSEGDAEDSE
jgi:DNA-binding response OmpR family regulator